MNVNPILLTSGILVIVAIAVIVKRDVLISTPYLSIKITDKQLPYQLE